MIPHSINDTYEPALTVIVLFCLNSSDTITVSQIVQFISQYVELNKYQQQRLTQRLYYKLSRLEKIGIITHHTAAQGNNIINIYKTKTA